MSVDGWLPPGVTDADIDRACAPFEPFYCVRCYHHRWHCSEVGLRQCQLCEHEESHHKESDND